MKERKTRLKRKLRVGRHHLISKNRKVKRLQRNHPLKRALRPVIVGIRGSRMSRPLQNKTSKSSSRSHSRKEKTMRISLSSKRWRQQLPLIAMFMMSANQTHRLLVSDPGPQRLEKPKTARNTKKIMRMRRIRKVKISRGRDSHHQHKVTNTLKLSNYLRCLRQRSLNIATGILLIQMQ